LGHQWDIDLSSRALVRSLTKSTILRKLEASHNETSGPECFATVRTALLRGDGAVEWHDRPRPKGSYSMGLLCRSIDTCILGRKPTIISSALACPRPALGKRIMFFPEALKKAMPRLGKIIRNMLLVTLGL
jgi:hypothetical protein